MNPAPTLTTIPPLVGVRPLIMLTGFLGAGKTTFLRRCLAALKKRQILADVILNDRENAELDCETLRDQAADVTPLAGSCVCCEALDELCGLILAAAGSRHDALFLELNGTADPLPLLESFTLLESRFLLRPRWQVAVIDARHFRNRGFYQDLETLQLETASHYHLAHTEELGAADLLRVRRQVEAVNPNASETDPESMIEHLARVLSRNRRTAIGKKETRRDHGHLPGPVGLDDRHHLAHQFTGCQILVSDPLPAVRVIGWLANLPAEIIRAKILVRTADSTSERHLFERVGREVCPNPIPVPIRDCVPSSAILIGAELDPEALLASARHALGSDCTLGS
jgi:G3E family GTPase